MNFIYIKSFICIFALAIIASCSMPKILYNNVDFLLLNWFDAYFELHKKQRSDLKKKIGRIVKWHRKTELPKTIRFLQELKYRYATGINQNDISWMRSKFKILWDEILNHALDDLGAFLLTVDDGQVLQMEKKLLENNEFLVKQSKMGSTELHENTLDWLYGVFETWLGVLNADQEQKIATWVKPDSKWIGIKLENRKKLQENFSSLLKSKEPLKKSLNTWLFHPELNWTDEFKLHVENKKHEWVDIILKLDAITLPHQRKHAASKLQSYIDDFSELSKL